MGAGTGHGGSGGVGHVALQLAKNWRAEVFSTGGGDKQTALIERLGATSINYKTETVTPTNCRLAACTTY